MVSSVSESRRWRSRLFQRRGPSNVKWLERVLRRRTWEIYRVESSSSVHERHKRQITPGATPSKCILSLQVYLIPALSTEISRHVPLAACRWRQDIKQYATSWCTSNIFITLHYTAIITALHGTPARTGYKKAVCPSVSQTRVLWQNGRKICPVFLYHTKDNLA